MKNGDRVEINAPGTAWHRFVGVITNAPVQVTRCQITLDYAGSSKVVWYDRRELLPASVVDRLADIGRFLPTEADIGRGVVYTPYSGAQAEDGVITSLNDEFVFVRYKGQHPGAGGQATRRQDLRWL